MICFEKWYADFEFTVSSDVRFNAVDPESDGYLSGSYANWLQGAWISVPGTDVTIQANKPLRIMAFGDELLGTNGLKQTYREIVDVVKEFKCGVMLREAFRQANPGFKVTLALKLYNPENEEESFKVGPMYTFELPSDSHYITVTDVYGNIVNCESMQKVVESIVASGATANGSELNLLKDTAIAENLTMTGTRNLFLNFDSGKELSLAEGKRFALSNINVAITGAGSLVGFTAENVTLDDNSVLTLPSTASALAAGLQAKGLYVTKNEDETWSVANNFQLQIQVADGVASLGFLKDTRRTYTVEASSDLVNWEPVDSIEADNVEEKDSAVPLKWNTPQSGQFFRVKATDAE
jgi:hypothetical protein